MDRDDRSISGEQFLRDTLHAVLPLAANDDLGVSHTAQSIVDKGEKPVTEGFGRVEFRGVELSET
jgi:hypothetical protein